MAKNVSKLVAAAMTLDEHLRAFDALVGNTERVQLNSQRNIEKAAHTATEAAQGQQQLGTLIQVFLQALNEARDHHQQSASALARRGEEIGRRGVELNALRERMAAIAVEGTGISEAVKRVSGDPAQRAAMLPELGEIEKRMTACVEKATQLHDDCKAAGFSDVTADADSIRQQLQSARNKVKLLRDQILTTDN
jgi:chromosome segregation ATPase